MIPTLYSLERRVLALQRAHAYTPHKWTMGTVDIARAIGIEPDPWQEEFLQCQDQRMLANCSRQTGKSLMAAIIGMHTTLSQNNATVLCLSPSLRQSGELFRKCMHIYNTLNRPVATLAESTLRLELVNGSRVLSLPGSEATIRGISAVSLLILDEASRIPDELFTAVSPMLAVSNGRQIEMSTPFGARGHFYESYKHRANWKYFEIDATQCPRISPEFLESERRNLGEWHFMQEYCCQFMASQAAQFRTQDIEAIIQEDIEVWTF